MTTVVVAAEDRAVAASKGGGGNDNDDMDADDNHDDDSDVASEAVEPVGQFVGGTLRNNSVMAAAAFCLLDGHRVSDGDAHDNVVLERVTVPIARLPLTVGRAPAASAAAAAATNVNKNFVGLGGGTDSTVAKAVSRQHVRIDYRVAMSNGTCGFLQSKSSDDHQDNVDDDDDSLTEFDFCMDEPLAATDIIILDSILAETTKGTHTATTKASPLSLSLLPESGFYTLTVVGRNRVLVHGQRVDPGQTVWLIPGSPVRMANYCFYFLTPPNNSTSIENDNDEGGIKRRTMQVEDISSNSSSSSKKGSSENHAPDVAPSSSSDNGPVPAKKRKLSLAVSTAIPAVAGSGSGPTGMGTGGGGGTGGTSASGKPTLQSEIEDLSTDELLQQMTHAVEEQVWDRRHQLIGSTISCRAVIVAAQDPLLYAVAQQAQGQLSRTEIMDWIAASPQFRNWVEQMLSKMEAKSYQASITKALIKAGFTRTASTGRYIKWHLPESLQHQEHNDEDMVGTGTAIGHGNGPIAASAAAKAKQEDQQDEEDDDDDDDDDDGDDGEEQSAVSNSHKVEQNDDEEEDDDNDDEDDDDDNESPMESAGLDLAEDSPF